NAPRAPECARDEETRRSESREKASDHEDPVRLRVWHAIDREKAHCDIASPCRTPAHYHELCSELPGATWCRSAVVRAGGGHVARARGFTLIEMMAVVLILGLVMSVVVVNVMERVEWAKVQTTKIKLSSVEGALEMYQLENAAYPDTDPGLVALLQHEPG